MADMRSQNIDALKGTAILIVMAGHVLTWNHMEDGYIYDVIKVIQMPLFIMVSGYLCGIGRRVSDLTQYRRITLHFKKTCRFLPGSVLFLDCPAPSQASAVQHLGNPVLPGQRSVVFDDAVSSEPDDLHGPAGGSEGGSS